MAHEHRDIGIGVVDVIGDDVDAASGGGRTVNVNSGPKSGLPLLIDIQWVLAARIDMDVIIVQSGDRSGSDSYAVIQQYHITDLKTENGVVPGRRGGRVKINLFSVGIHVRKHELIKV